MTSIGTLILKNIRSQKEWLFAAFPVLFAIQQFIEGTIWLVIQNEKPEVLHWLTFSYLIFAYSLWPILCPLSVYLIEYDKKRRGILRFLILLGVATSFYLLFFLITNPFHATAMNCNIHYETFVAGGHLFTGVYIIAVILPYFISSHKDILIFGIPNLVFCMIAYFFYRMAFISTWCFFAAVLSLTLYFFLRKLHHRPLLSIAPAP